MVEPFDPGEGEDKLYHLVSDYLRRENLQALPPSQRSLMTLVLRKLLASSSFAFAKARELDFEINEAMTATRRKLFENFDDEEMMLDEEQVRRMLTLPAIDLTTKNTENTKRLPKSEPLISPSVFSVLSVVQTQRQTDIQRQVSERNALFYEAEAAKLDGWADGRMT